MHDWRVAEEAGEIAGAALRGDGLEHELARDAELEAMAAAELARTVVE